jgi:putative membrane protein
MRTRDWFAFRVTGPAACLTACVMILAQGTALADTTVSQRDRAFLDKAAQGGELEVKAGKLAAQRGASPAVKSFGQQMVTDHTAANDMLRSLAASKQLPLPPDLTPEQTKLLGKLEGLSGTEFDEAYASMMVSDHKQDISEFQHEASSGQDPDIKSYASQTLPTLRHHLMLANNLVKQHERQ